MDDPRSLHSYFLSVIAIALFTTALGTPAHAQCLGDRWVAIDGIDIGNDCHDSALPCGSLNHAIAMACDLETVRVGEGDYVEDVVIDHPVNVHGTGHILLTHVQGSGTTDAVKILSSNVSWGNLTVWHTPGHALMRVGDPAHPNLRGIQLENATFRESSLGIVLDSTGYDEAMAWNRFANVIVRDIQPDGSLWGGVGIVLTGGNGKFQLIAGRLHHDAGGGLLIEPAPVGAENRRIVIAGQYFYDNGLSALGPTNAALDLRGVTDIEIEGNEFYNQTGASGDDGRGLVLQDASGVKLVCNRFHDNDAGVVLRGTTHDVSLSYNNFTNNLGGGAAVRVESTAGANVALAQNIFRGNGSAIDNAASNALDARRNWFGAVDGPGPVGTGDSISGNIDSAGFITRAAEPLLVRRPQNSGWAFPQAACYERVSDAVAAAVAGDLVLIGEGEYYEHLVIGQRIDLAGEQNPAGCPKAIIRGEQFGTLLPALKIDGVDGIQVSDLTIRSVAQGRTCGDPNSAQVGLDLHDVSNSSFSRLCLKENGVSEVRLTGAAHHNVLSDLDVDGMTQDMFGRDSCGHRSREAVLIAGSPVCLGGAGAVPDHNQIVRLNARRVSRGVSLQLATNTEIADGSIDADVAPAWDGGGTSYGVLIGLAGDTSIHGLELGSATTREAIRIAGRDSQTCATEMTDSAGTAITGNNLHATIAGVHLFRELGDPGAPTNVTVSCNTISTSLDGVLVDELNAATSPVLVTRNDISGNSAGVRNLGALTVDANGNWWGHSSGPSGAGSGSGDAVLGAVDFLSYLQNFAVLDADGDGVSLCQGDCGYTQSTVFPGAPELCDTLDNDCNGRVDDPPRPGRVNGLTLNRWAGDSLRLTWDAVAGADGYDIVKGSPEQLLATGGSFAAATSACLAGHLGTTGVIDLPFDDGGSNAWYLVRAENCGGPGTFDMPNPGQAAPRDAQIAAASNACP